MRISHIFACFVLATTMIFNAVSGSQSGKGQTAPASRNTSELPEPVVQTSHSLAITALVSSSRSGLLASGSKDGTVKVWSTRTGELLNTLSVSNAWVRSLAFSPDGQRIAVGAGDHIAYLYDPLSGALLRRFEGANSAITAVAISGDGRMLAAGTSRDEIVRVWKLDTVAPYVEIRKKPPVRTLAFARDTDVLLLADKSSTSQWRIGQRGEVEELPPSNEPPYIVGITSPPMLKTIQNKLVAVDETKGEVAVANGRMLIWSARTDGISKRSAPLSASGVRSIRFSPDDRTLAMGMNTGDVAIWDLEFGEMGNYLQNVAGISQAYANAIAFSRDGATLMAIRGDDRTHWSWKLGSSTPPNLPPRSLDVNGSPTDSFLDEGVDFGRPPPLGAPGGLHIVGDPESFKTNYAFIPSSGECGIYGGWISPSSMPFISKVNLVTGADLWTLRAPERRTRRLTSIAATPDCSTIAVAFDDHTIDWINGENGTVIRSVPSAKDQWITTLQFSMQGNMLAAGAPNGIIQIWNSDGQTLPTPAPHRAAVLSFAFSADGSILASGGADNAIKIWDVRNSRFVRALEGHSSAVTALAFAHACDIIASGSEDSTMKIWNGANGDLLATSSALGRDGWLVISPQGFFDGTRQSWNAVPFRFRSAPDRFYRPEQFFAQFFQPGLLAEVISRQMPILDLLREQHDKRADLNITSYLQSKLPVVQIQATKSTREIADKTVQIQVSAMDCGSGLRDLRIFRNQSLVKFIHGDLKVDPETRRYIDRIPVEITAGENEISAYAFNRDGLKSEDSAISVVGAASLRRTGRAYVLAVGVNLYSNSEFNLRFAAPDAELIAPALRESLLKTGSYADVLPVVLKDKEATKANVLLALKLLAGIQQSPVQSAPPQLRSLQRTKPEDTVIIYFAGHGAAAGNRYYLLTHDIGYQGSRRLIPAEAWRTIFAEAVSDRELNDMLEQIDAAQVMLVIDACHSGHVLESEENRRGPLNSQGIAQLAYEKGSYVLAASQSNQAALELQRLGNGVLTYVLVEKGLKNFDADTDGDGQITVGEWFRYACNQVTMELSTPSENPLSSQRMITVDGQPLGLQRPRSYFRHDRPDNWLVAARKR
jgi:WD40 repeat protein